MYYGRGGCYFVSDVHLGARDEDIARERNFVDFLSNLPPDTSDVYLLGDIFDFWVEYEDVVPRGYVRVLGALVSLSDRGVRLHFVKGNHDWWLTDYLVSEFSMEVIDERCSVRRIEGYDVCFGHGDGLGKLDFGSKFIFMLFRSPFCIALLKTIHPCIVFRFARWWSRHSRKKHSGYHFHGESEPLVRYLEGFASEKAFDLAVFGHLHTQVTHRLADGKILYVLGEWDRGVNYLNLSGMNISGLGFPNME